MNIGANGGLSHSDSISKSYNIGAVIGAIVGPVAAGAGSVIAGPVGGFVAGRLANAVCNAIPTKTEAEQNGANIGGSLGYGYGWGSSKATTTADGKTTGFSNSVSIGESKTTSYNYKSYMVSDLVNRLEKSIKRVEEGQGTGLWKYAVYVISNEAKVSENVASSLMSITQGNESYLEPSYIQNWFFEKSNGITPFSELTKYISSFTHPVFISLDGTMAVTPTSYISTKDLAHVVTFPKKSLQGMPVLQGVQFGREPNSLAQTNERISLGNAYHMFEEVPNVSINISKDSLSSHTFITGSTGTGKSNTIYHILNELCLENGDTHFLVIEPAKGEYKRVFGKRKDVNVYGTNPDLTPLLHINPFSFPVGKIHIYEHLDRLVEIFNVCWPMYAAMPAVLKEAIERAYLAAGWDLKTSKNRYNQNLFPSFCDVLSEIENVIDNSQYSSDSKGDYKGALLTRVRSLTNGINGLIFSSEEQTDEQLFDKNVIIDLSRVGAVETTSLIMGIIVMKLQEYRMAQGKTNAKLCHVTVLEEAHNILKKTSMEQSSESSNIAGKSVEMLTNAIAEMRTYGEGFIIADQAPCLLDEAVIRNTNTKIVLRIPDYADRQLVGKSMGMNDNQIDEIARMENYVAAVYQSGWLESVLCKVAEANVSEEEYSLQQKEQPTSLKAEIIQRLKEKKLNSLIDKKDEERIATSDLSIKAKRFLYEYIKDDAEKYRLAAGIAYEVLDGASIMAATNKKDSFEEQKGTLNRLINENLACNLTENHELLVELIVLWHSQITNNEEYRRLAKHLIEQKGLEAFYNVK